MFFIMIVSYHIIKTFLYYIKCQKITQDIKSSSITNVLIVPIVHHKIKKMIIPDITEAKAIKLFNQKFGTDFITRWNKFSEEVSELTEVVNNILEARNNGQQPTDFDIDHLKDELSDVQSTFTHLASLFGQYQKQMLESAIDKVTTRETDPNYKRYNH